MSLLTEIQDATTDPGTSMTALLLKCQLLAARLDYAPLREWVDKELNGYAQNELPDYRTLTRVTVLGTAAGGFGAMVKNMPIPATIIDQKHWHDLFDVEFRGGIGGFEHLAASSEGSFHEKWPAHYIQYYGQKPITANGMHLVDAWKVIPKGAIDAMLGTIRSRVLTLATEVERLNPAAGEPGSGTDPVPNQSLQQITQYIYSGGQAHLIAPAGTLQTGARNVVGSSAGRDITTGGEHTETQSGDTTVHQGERSWFARHPWISGISLGIVTGALPTIYIAIWGLHFP